MSEAQIKDLPVIAAGTRLRLEDRVRVEVSGEEVSMTVQQFVSAVLNDRIITATFLTPYDANHIGTSEEITTSDAGATACDLTVYETIVTTGGSEGAEDVTIGDGTGIKVGTRHLITLSALGESADSVTLDDANFSQGSDTITAIELDAAGEFILVEWQGASWEIIKASSGVVSVS